MASIGNGCRSFDHKDKYGGVVIPYQSWIENSLDKKGLRNTVALIQNGPHRLSKQCLSSKKGNHHCIFCSSYYHYTAHTYFSVSAIEQQRIAVV